MLTQLANEFVLLFEALRDFLGTELALLDSRVQAARRAWRNARGECHA